MKFKIGDRVKYLGGPSNDPTVYMDPDDPNIGREAVIVKPGTGGWEWTIAMGDEQFMADECQLAFALH